MRRAASGLLILLLLSSPFTGQTAEWKTYKNTDGNFSVLFPGTPTDSVNKTDDEIRSHTLMVVDKPVVYTVVYTAMSGTQKVDDATYQVFKSSVFKELPNCEASAEGRPAPAIEGYIGHWYRLGCDVSGSKVTVAGNLYWGKHYAFAVMVMFTTSGPDPAGIRKFVDSFAILDPAK
jgi:hypothetical protein